MIPANETFGGSFPFQPNFTSAPGFNMHYVDEGEGEVIICLHGEPTWGYLYRNFIPPLSKKYRVIVPDHMGFGKSETPQDRSYRFGTHVDNLIAFVQDLDLRDITFVAQDWGGPMAGSFALRHPDRVKRLCLMNTMLGFSGAVRDSNQPSPPDIQLHQSQWFKWILDNLDSGVYHEVMSNLGSNVLSVMKKLNFVNSACIDDEWIRAYSMPFSSVEETIAAIEFPLNVAHNRITDYVIEGLKKGNLEKVRSLPAMLAEGLQDKAMPPELVLHDFAVLFPHAPVTLIQEAGHFCQEDVPEILVALIDQFVQMT